MRRYVWIVLCAALLAAAGCTMGQPEPRVITATPRTRLLTPGDTPAAIAQGPESTAAPSPEPSATPAEPASPTVAPSPTPTTSPPSPTAPPADTATPAPTWTSFVPPPTLAPTRTPASSPPPQPLDDGSGRVIAGTGGQLAGIGSTETGTILPETLYFLSGDPAALQVWRLQWGLFEAEQLSFNAWGVTDYSVAPDGVLAYLSGDGALTVGGLPVPAPTAPDGSQPTPRALAWAPLGGWLAYVQRTPEGDFASAGEHPEDGVWMRSTDGQTVHLAQSRYGEDFAVYTGPISWRPDGSEVLVGTETPRGFAVTRVDITSGTVTPVWNDGALPPGTYHDAQWSINGNAIIASTADQVLRIEPGTLGTQILLPSGAGLAPADAQQFANGAVTFAAQPAGDAGGAWRLYLIAQPGAAAPEAISGTLAAGGRIEFLWGNFGEQVLIVAYPEADAALGTAYTNSGEGSSFTDLTALAGQISAPSWGPIFTRTDFARVNTTDGEPLNLRNAPGGSVQISLPSGTRLTILGGPRVFDGLNWWQVRTTDGVAGWVAESVTDDRGLRLRTLVPVG